MQRQRDVKKGKLYKAEQAVRKEISKKEFETVDECHKYVHNIVNSKWFRKHYPNCPTEVEIHDGGGMRSAYGGLQGGKVWMGLPKWSRYDIVILHELAHNITPDKLAAHGREFCANLLKLVKRFVGKEAHDILRQSMKDHKVPYRPKRKLSPEHRAKAIAQLKKLGTKPPTKPKRPKRVKALKDLNNIIQRKYPELRLYRSNQGYYYWIGSDDNNEAGVALTNVASLCIYNWRFMRNRREGETALVLDWIQKADEAVKEAEGCSSFKFIKNKTWFVDLDKDYKLDVDAIEFRETREEELTEEDFKRIGSNIREAVERVDWDSVASNFNRKAGK